MATTNAPASVTSTSGDLQAGIAETNRRFEAAMAAGDATRATEEVYTRDARIMPPGASTVTGRTAIAQFWGTAVAQMGVQGVTLRTVELTPMGDGAVEIGEATLTLAGGQAVAKYVVVWRHEEDRWRWHVDIWNMNA